MHEIILLVHDIRSCHNVGSLLRTAEGFGVKKVYLTGYTPYPVKSNDPRLPHLAQKIEKQIQKTALGAEKLVDWQQSDSVEDILEKLKNDGYEIIALEQTDRSVKLPDYKPSIKSALLIGREVEGIDNDLLDLCDVVIEIPMFGKKESFNVVQASAVALYHCVFSKS